MYCSNCGKQVPDGSRFCGECGAKQERETALIIREQPKKKWGKIFAIVLAAVIVIGAGAFGGKRLFNLESGNAIVYLDDGTYYVIPNVGKDKVIELADLSNEQDINPKVHFSNDGKYLYYFSKFDVDSLSGKLCRVKYGSLKEDSEKNKALAETVDSNVLHYSIIMVGDNSAVYQTSDDSLWYFDGKDSVRISRNVSQFVANDQGILYSIKNDATNYYTVYGVKYSGIEEPIELINEVSTFDYADADTYTEFTDYIYCTKSSEVSGDTTCTLYIANTNMEAKKIASGVRDFNEIDGILYYTVASGEKSYLTEYVSDTLKISDSNVSRSSSNYSEATSRNELRTSLSSENNALSIDTLYRYKNGQSEVITERAICVNLYNNVSYTDVDAEFDMLDITDIDNSYTVSYELIKQNCYTYIPSADTFRDISQVKGMQDIDSDYSIYATKTALFISESGNIRKLSYIPVSNGKLGDLIEIAKVDAHIFVFGTDYDEDIVYYGTDIIYGNTGSPTGDMYQFQVGDSEPSMVMEDISLYWSNLLYDDGTLVAYYGLSSNDDNELVYSKQGKQTIIAENVKMYQRMGKNLFIILSDGDVYSYDGKETALLAKNVDTFWCSNVINEAQLIYIGD